jgi:hypothetical protein
MAHALTNTRHINEGDPGRLQTAVCTQGRFPTSALFQRTSSSMLSNKNDFGFLNWKLCAHRKFSSKKSSVCRALGHMPNPLLGSSGTLKTETPGTFNKRGSHCHVRITSYRRRSRRRLLWRRGSTLLQPISKSASRTSGERHPFIEPDTNTLLPCSGGSSSQHAGENARVCPCPF